MPLDLYGVLKGKAQDRRTSAPGQSHYQLLLSTDGDGGGLYRAAINVRSKLHPSAVEYLVLPGLEHPVLEELSRLALGFHYLPNVEGGAALDYIRFNLIDPGMFLTLPCDGPGCRADLNAVLDEVFLDAIDDPHARVYVYGEPWENLNASDPIFRFRPSRGMHEVHMNQGNDPSHWEQDGIWQDGAVLVEHRESAQWIGVFLKFQSQSWHTDDLNGHALKPPKSFDGTRRTPLDREGRPYPDGMVRLVAASLEPLSVTLLNVCPFPVDLSGWSIVNRKQNRWRLKGSLAAGEVREIPFGRMMTFDPQGGLLTLLNHHGLKVDGVSYTSEQLTESDGELFFRGPSFPIRWPGADG